MFLVTIYLNMSSVNNFTPNEPPGELSLPNISFFKKKICNDCFLSMNEVIHLASLANTVALKTSVATSNAMALVV